MTRPFVLQVISCIGQPLYVKCCDLYNQATVKLIPSLTWKTLGALTSEARAEDRVAEKIPAEMSGAKPETRLITYKICAHKDTHDETSPFVSIARRG